MRRLLLVGSNQWCEDEDNVKKIWQFQEQLAECDANY